MLFVAVAVGFVAIFFSGVEKIKFGPVVELERPPSKRKFMQELRKAPFVIKKGALDGWDARAIWTDEYLKRVAGEEVFSVEISPNSLYGDLQAGWRFENMTLREFLDDRGQRKAYLNGLIPKKLFPDIYLPVFVPCLGDVRPPFERLINWWIGKGGEVSLLHNDLQDNVLHLVRGRKRVVLFSPSDAPYLYETYASRTETRLSPIRPDSPDFAKFPDFEKAKGLEVTLIDGEALFIPALWFHEVSSFGSTLAVNVWFDLFDYAKRGLEHVYKTPSNVLAGEMSKHECLCPDYAIGEHKK